MPEVRADEVTLSGLDRVEAQLRRVGSEAREARQEAREARQEIERLDKATEQAGARAHKMTAEAREAATGGARAAGLPEATGGLSEQRQAQIAAGEEAVLGWAGVKPTPQPEMPGMGREEMLRQERGAGALIRPPWTPGPFIGGPPPPRDYRAEAMEAYRSYQEERLARPERRMMAQRAAVREEFWASRGITDEFEMARMERRATEAQARRIAPTVEAAQMRAAQRAMGGGAHPLAGLAAAEQAITGRQQEATAAEKAAQAEARLARIHEEVARTGRATGASTKEISDAYQELYGTGTYAEGTLGKINAQLERARRESRSYDALSDSLGRMSRHGTILLGVLTGMVAYAAKVGFAWEEAEASMRGMTGSAEAAERAMEDASAVADQFGLSLQDMLQTMPMLQAAVSGTTDSLRSAMETTAQLAAGLGIPFQQAAQIIAGAISGGISQVPLQVRAALGLNQRDFARWREQGVSAIEGIREAIDRSGVGDAAAAQAQSAAASWNRFKNEALRAWVAFYQALGPSIEELMKDAAALARAIGEFAKAHPELVEWLVKAVAAFALLEIGVGRAGRTLLALREVSSFLRSFAVWIRPGTAAMEGMAAATEATTVAMQGAATATTTWNVAGLAAIGIWGAVAAAIGLATVAIWKDVEAWREASKAAHEAGETAAETRAMAREHTERVQGEARAAGRPAPPAVGGMPWMEEGPPPEPMPGTVWGVLWADRQARQRAAAERHRIYRERGMAGLREMREQYGPDWQAGLAAYYLRESWGRPEPMARRASPLMAERIGFEQEMRRRGIAPGTAAYTREFAAWSAPHRQAERVRAEQRTAAVAGAAQAEADVAGAERRLRIIANEIQLKERYGAKTEQLLPLLREEQTRQKELAAEYQRTADNLRKLGPQHEEEAQRYQLQAEAQTQAARVTEAEIVTAQRRMVEERKTLELEWVEFRYRWEQVSAEQYITVLREREQEARRAHGAESREYLQAIERRMSAERAAEEKLRADREKRAQEAREQFTGPLAGLDAYMDALRAAIELADQMGDAAGVKQLRAELEATTREAERVARTLLLPELRRQFAAGQIPQEVISQAEQRVIAYQAAPLARAEQARQQARVRRQELAAAWQTPETEWRMRAVERQRERVPQVWMRERQAEIERMTRSLREVERAERDVAAQRDLVGQHTAEWYRLATAIADATDEVEQFAQSLRPSLQDTLDLMRSLSEIPTRFGMEARARYEETLRTQSAQLAPQVQPLIARQMAGGELTPAEREQVRVAQYVFEELRRLETERRTDVREIARELAELPGPQGERARADYEARLRAEYADLEARLREPLQRPPEAWTPEERQWLEEARGIAREIQGLVEARQADVDEADRRFREWQEDRLRTMAGWPGGQVGGPGAGAAWGRGMAAPSRIERTAELTSMAINAPEGLWRVLPSLAELRARRELRPTFIVYVGEGPYKEYVRSHVRVVMRDHLEDAARMNWGGEP